MHVRLALAVAGALLLAGCSDDPEPTPKLPDLTSSSPSPTASESETPEAESAEDFVRRWVEISNEMQNTGETSEYLEISSRCAACKQVAQRVETVFDAGGFFKTDGWTIRSITDRSGNGARQVLDVRVDSAPTLIKESSAAKEERLPGGDLVYRFRLGASQPWSLAQLTQVPS
jgi:hypothetical protein